MTRYLRMVSKKRSKRSTHKKSFNTYSYLQTTKTILVVVEKQNHFICLSIAKFIINHQNVCHFKKDHRPSSECINVQASQLLVYWVN